MSTDSIQALHRICGDLTTIRSILCDVQSDIEDNNLHLSIVRLKMDVKDKIFEAKDLYAQSLSSLKNETENQQ